MDLEAYFNQLVRCLPVDFFDGTPLHFTAQHWETRIIPLMVEKLLLIPDGEEQCWIHQGYASEEYANIHVPAVGDCKPRKTRVHHLSYVLLNPGHSVLLKQTKRGENTFEISHLCHNAGTLGPKCFNPHHLRLESQSYNKSRRFCRYGFSALCPHQPVCIWTDANGIPYKWRNNPNITVPDDEKNK